LLPSLVQRQSLRQEIRVPGRNLRDRGGQTGIWVARPELPQQNVETDNPVNESLHTLVGFVSDHAEWAYATVFLAALLEAVPVVGSFVPGTTVIVAISALVPLGRLSLAAILFASILGAALGDGAAYWVGHKLKRRILELWPLSAYPTLIAQSEEFFRRHGTLAVLFARFVAPIRAFVPVTAGALGMAPIRFFTVNVPAVVLWAVAHVVSSAFAGTLVAEWGERIAPYALAAAAVVAVIAFLLWAQKHWHLCHPHFHLHHRPKSTGEGS
jgi:membrane protein DedA with SNARE-associated domain